MIKYSPVGYVDANTVNGTVTLAVDIEFFNSGQTETIYWTLSAAFCEFKANEISDDTMITQLTGTDSLSGSDVEYNYFGREAVRKSKLTHQCAITSLTITDDINGGEPDPRIFIIGQ